MRDLPTSVRWYADLLGLEPDFVPSGPSRFLLRTDDMTATADHLRAVGAPAVPDAVDVDGPTFVTFEDPDGSPPMVAEPAVAKAP